ncbi:hypothetical protein [Caloranaerobacter azorensis]|uniref:Uncharacterized protein n=1 Tax=Caloranaerobacter azorensis TaxID=116090 RepID=A0A6P1YDH1_9FIRM|nr:hypothetical protein [Caloranaerobacter azorensis]QIB26972.1 hypothetical protein G3A45_06505 [Caloranaerobacter azorensis]
MKKMLILPLILGLLIPGATTVNAQSFDNGSDPEIHPYYVVYCPGDSPDGKHHYFSASRNYSLTLWDANKNPIRIGECLILTQFYIRGENECLLVTY